MEDQNKVSINPNSLLKTQQYSKNPSRINSIDMLRGYCVFLMIAWHYYFFLKVDYLETNYFILWVMNIIGIAGNPIFIIVMGVSLALSIDRRKKRGEDFKSNIIHLTKRALLFFLVHHVMVISYFLYFGPLIFDMNGLYPGWIPSLGINAVICFLLMYLRKIYRFFIMIGVQSIAFITPLPILSLFQNILFHMIFGTIVGELIIEARNNNNQRHFIKKMAVSGIILMIIGIPSEYYVYQTYDLSVPNNSVLNSPFFMIYALGFFTLSFSLLFWIQDLNTRKRRIFHPLTIFSSLSLTLFYSHYALGTNFFLPFGFGNRFSVYSYIVFLICFYISTYLIGILWSKSKYKYSLEWIIRKFS
ncbi:MAG: heparan-alpha-glucosaminide N-acetyltransferase domain-containing protein [Candidatus Helarchaeota archaeon]